MRRLAEGDDTAMGELMERHGASIYNYLVRLLGDEAQARDLAQETFVRVFRARETFRSDANFCAWVFTIAGNLGRNHLRWRQRHPETPLDSLTTRDNRPPEEVLPGPARTPSDAAATAEIGEAVRRAIEG